MVSTQSSVLLIAATSALAFQANVNADPCDGDNYSKVAAAAQNIHTNCASYHAYLANGGTWTCDSKCHDAVSNLVNTLPDCTFGGPYGQNYKQVVENMVATCGGQVSTDSTTAPSSTTATPTTDNNSTETATTTQTTDAPTAATDAPTTIDDKNDKKDTTDASASASADDAGTPASDVSTTSAANTMTVTSITAFVLAVAGALLH
ncbi:hypothetical protein PHMEG_00041356 [Phytophthora megakarya]|uniref:Elicitin n=1 Tax=Phytophthora megakarya TaxID=4795 RepID=A0A225UBS1_9STRA|nr:hypothetical protein PHMEG_00041356 [Phytophthora megakarya]